MNPSDPIFVLKEGKRLGPFSIDDLLEEVERGAVNYEDACLRTGSSECERVRDILDWDEPPSGDETVRDAPPEPEPQRESSRIFFQETEPPAAIQPEAEADFDTEPESELADDYDEEDEEDDFNLEEETLETVDELQEPGPPLNPNAILYAGHPSFLSFPRTLILTFFALGIGLWFRETSSWIFLAGLVIALFGVSWIFLERSMHLFLITPRRVEIVTGLFAKSSNEVRIDDIRTINVLKSGFVGLIGVGTVEFASAGGSTVEVSFQNVWAANRIKGLVRRLQDAQDG